MRSLPEPKSPQPAAVDPKPLATRVSAWSARSVRYGSGRGVALHVVKKLIEKIAGTVDVFLRSRLAYNCAHEDSVDAGDYSALLMTSARNR